jgi:hypothetical protein
VSAVVEGAFDVANDPFDQIEMRSVWGMHEETHLMNDIGYLTTGEGEILKGSDEATVKSLIGE